MSFKKSIQLSLSKKALAFFILFLPLSALAETLYVSDTLRVGIRTLPNTNVPSISIVKSGTAVEVLKRKGSYIKIRTKNGVEGWVKGAYFSKKTPATKKLKEALNEISSLEKEIQSLNKQKNAQMKNATPDLSNEVKTLESRNQALKNEVLALKNTPKTSNTAPSFSLNDIDKNIIYGAVGGLVVLLCLGFLFGVSWHKSQVTKRLGGMSI